MSTTAQQPLVSVIIPVYNVAQYLDTCLESVVTQAYRQLEIILVDDNSTDNSVAIARRWAATDPRIRLIEKPHEGLPTTRRRGLEVATGKYIQHLDSDDWLCEGAIGTLVACAEEHEADLVASPYIQVTPARQFVVPDSFDFEQKSGYDYLDGLLDTRYAWCIWANFHRRDLYERCDVRLVPEINMGEDGILLVQLAAHDIRVVSQPKPTLNYRYNPTSITNDPAKNQQISHEVRQLYTWIESYLESRGLLARYRKALEVRYFICSIEAVLRNDHTTIRQDFRRYAAAQKQYGDLFGHLTYRRIRRLANLYCKSALLGDLKYVYYRLRKKI